MTNDIKSSDDHELGQGIGVSPLSCIAYMTGAVDETDERTYIVLKCPLDEFSRTFSIPSSFSRCQIPWTRSPSDCPNHLLRPGHHRPVHSWKVEIDAVELLPPLWGQTVRAEQRPVVDSICYLDRDSSMAEAILFDTSGRGLLEDVSGKGQMGIDIWGAKPMVWETGERDDKDQNQPDSVP